MGEEEKTNVLCKHWSSKFLFKVVTKIDDTSVQIRLECMLLLRMEHFEIEIYLKLNVKINIRVESK